MSIFLLFSMNVTAFAEDIIIDTTVPDSHKLTVSANGAEVFFEGVTVTEISVGRLTEPTVLIRADSGKAIKQLLLNGEDITSQIKGGYYTFSPVCEDKTLTVITEDETPAVQTKTYTVIGTVRLNGEPVTDMTLELRSTTKTAVTDADGKVTFSDVECGKHSLTATENGRLVGYIEFVLSEGDSADLGLESNGVYHITADKNKIGINLVLNLTEQDTMTAESVSDAHSCMMWRILLIIIIICGVLFVIILLVLKKRKQQAENEKT